MGRPGPGRGRCWNSGSTTCCSPTAWRRKSMSDTVARPEIVREISGADEFGIVEKEFSTFERLYNLGWVRKTGLLIVLAVVWEVYARYLDNQLLVPTLSDTFRAWWEGMESGVLPERILAS